VIFVAVAASIFQQAFNQWLSLCTGNMDTGNTSIPPSTNVISHILLFPTQFQHYFRQRLPSLLAHRQLLFLLFFR
jgi:hypothetical protein